MPQDSQADLASHLRAVHFALTVACIGLLITPFVNTSVETQTAYRHIREIVDATGTWDRDWLNKSVDRVLTGKKLSKSAESLPEIIEIDRFDRNPVRLSWRGNLWTLFSPGTVEPMTNPFSEVPPNLTPDLVIPYQKDLSLKDFLRYWDALRGKRLVAAQALYPELLLAVSPGILGGSGPPSISVRRWKATEAANCCKANFTVVFVRVESIAGFWDEGLHEKHLREELLEKHVVVWQGFYQPPIGDEAAGVTESVVIPVQAEVIPFDGQAHLLEHLAELHVKVDWRRGSSKDTFRELNTITEKYQDLKLEQISSILESSGKTGEGFEIVGLKIPAAALRTWGLLAILGLQLYFYLHLREFIRIITPAGEGWSVAWIALYPDPGAKVVFIVSAYILPVVVVLVLAIACLRSTSESRLFCVSLSVPSIILSAVVAGASSRLTWHLKRPILEVPQQSGSADVSRTPCSPEVSALKPPDAGENG